MEAKSAEGQSKNSCRDKTRVGLHGLSSVRQSNQGRLDSFDKSNLFYSQNPLDDFFQVFDISNENRQLDLGLLTCVCVHLSFGDIPF